ncbi:SMI1/KNR4 family protein [Streptomyces coeruleorubidus]|uniref:SMI1/KNR4 family protein n=1 Tax=Streptomyces coeruleorubidus TaxID=116188 RepID=UPI003400F40D
MSDRSGHDRLERAWARFSTWLGEYAPVSCGLLRPGAADAQIDSAEQAIGVRFPAELRALYRIHDGVRGVELEEFGEQPISPRGDDDPWYRQANAVDFMPTGQAWLPLRHVISVYGGPLEIMAGGRVPYVPVTASANDAMLSGTYLDPATGVLGTWADAQELSPQGVGLADWLEDAVAALAEGRPTRVLGLRPYLSPTGDGLGWYEEDVMPEEDGWMPVAG